MPRSKINPTPGKVEMVTTIENRLLKLIKQFDEDLFQMSKVANLVHQLSWTLQKIKILQEELDQSDFIREFAKDRKIQKVPPQVMSLSLLQKTYIILFKTLYTIINDKMKQKMKEAKNKKEPAPVNPLDAFQQEFSVA